MSGVRRGKSVRTTIPAKDGHRANDLLNRQFTAPAPNTRWVADFTYCRTWAGFVYVAFVADVFSQRIVGWQAATDRHTDLVLTPLRIALWDRDRQGHPRRAGPAAAPLRRRQPVHLDQVHRAPRPRGHRTLDRHRRRRLRQRPDGVDHRPVQDRVPSPRPSSTTAPTRPSPTSSTPLSAGSTGTTTAACTAPSECSPQHEYEQAHYAALQPQQQTAKRSGREPVTVQPYLVDHTGTRRLPKPTPPTRSHRSPLEANLAEFVLAS